MSVPTFRPVSPPLGEPGRLLSLHAVRLRCVDETEHEGFGPIGGEGLANDAIRLFALSTVQVGNAAPVQFKTPVLNLGDNYEDGRSVDLDFELAAVWVPQGSPYPVKLNALLTLVEEDWGGRDWDAETKQIIDKVGQATGETLSKIATTAAGAAIGAAAGPVGSMVGAIVGAIVSQLTAATKNLESDLFPPTDVTVVLDGATSVLAGPKPRQLTQDLTFAGLGGEYVLTCQWRLFEQHATPSPPRINRLIFDILTGGDDLRGGNDNLNLLVERADGLVERHYNVNDSSRWADHQWQRVTVTVNPPVAVDMIKAVTFETTARGGIGGDNWNLDAVTIASDLGTVMPTRSGSPLHRFTGDAWSYRFQVR